MPSFCNVVKKIDNRDWDFCLAQTSEKTFRIPKKALDLSENKNRNYLGTED